MKQQKTSASTVRRVAEVLSRPFATQPTPAGVERDRMGLAAWWSRERCVQRTGRRPILEMLEPRLLLSSDLIGLEADDDARSDSALANGEVISAEPLAHDELSGGDLLQAQATSTTEAELIQNGSFGSGDAYWTRVLDFWVGAGSLPHTGSQYAAGGVDSDGWPKNNATGRMYQEVDIPADATSAELTYWYNITTEETGSDIADTMLVTVKDADGNHLRFAGTYSNLDDTGGSYQHAGPYDLSAYAGETVRVEFMATNDDLRPSVFRIDDVSLTALLPVTAPTVTELAPETITGSDEPQPFHIYGENFSEDDIVRLWDLDNEPHGPFDFSATNERSDRFTFHSEAHIEIEPIFTTEAATWTVEVRTPEGQSSGPIEFEVVAPSEGVHFEDANLEARVREVLDIPTGTITQEDMLTLTSLDASNRDITSLGGLEHATNLTTLELNSNNVSDISPVANLTNLATLSLGWNSISDISPLANLTNLTTLELNSNNVSDISPVANLTDLTTLWILANDISDISPVADLTDLTTLNLALNDISDISPVGNLTNLTALRIPANDISDISPVADLTDLTMLYFGWNNISDISPIANLTDLTTLSLDSNDISDITALAELSDLSNLWIQDNYLDISPGSATMAIIEDLQAQGTNVQYEPQNEAVGPAVSSVEDGEVEGSASRQWLTVHGERFASGFSVTFRDETNDVTYPTITDADRLGFISDEQVRVYAGVGIEAATWSVVVHNADGESSSPHAFEVVPPPEGGVDNAPNLAGDLGALADAGEAAVASELPEGAAHVYRLETTEPGELALEVEAERLGSDLDAYLRLFDAAGNEVAWADDTVGSDPVLTRHVAAGVYYVGVSSYVGRSYDPRQAEAEEGEGQAYELTASLTGEALPEPEPWEPVGALDLDGSFSQNAQGHWVATGQVVINDLLRIEGQVSHDAEMNVWGHGEVWVPDVPGLGDVVLYEGAFEFPAEQVATQWVDDAASEALSVAGLDVGVSRLSLLDDGVRVEGHLELPEALGAVRVDFAEPHFIDVTTEGVVYDFAVTTGDIDFEIFDTVGLSAQNAHLHVSNASGTPEATLTGTFTAEAFFGSAEVNLSAAEGNYFTFGADGWDFDGSIGVGDVTVGGWGLNGLTLTIDTVTSTVGGTADVRVPPGIDIAGTLAFVDGQLDEITLGVDGLNVPIGQTGAFLQALGGGVTNLATDQLAKFLGDVGATYGPELQVDMPLGLGSFKGSLLRGDVEGGIDRNHLAGEGELRLIGGLATGTGETDVNWNEGEVAVDGELDFLFGTVVGDFGFSAGMDLNITTRGSVSLNVPEAMPGPFKGMSLGGGEGHFQFVNDAEHIDWTEDLGEWWQAQDMSNNFIAGWTNLPLLGTQGFRINFDLSWQWIGADDVATFGAGSQLAPSGMLVSDDTVSEVFDLQRDDAPWQLLSARWENPSEAVELELTLPDGTHLHENEFGDQAELYEPLTSDTQRTVLVESPATGQWQLTVPDAGGLGSVELDALAGVEVAEPEVNSLTVVEGPEPDQWQIDYELGGEDVAELALLYDAEAPGPRGRVIDRFEPEAMEGSYIWDVSNVPTGRYAVSAIALDELGMASPATYALDPVQVVHPDAPSAPTGLIAPAQTDDGVRLAWTAPVGEVAGYRIAVTPDAADAGYARILAADQPGASLDGLDEGRAYRVAVGAVSDQGHRSPFSDPIVIVPGGAGAYEAPADALAWSVFATPGETYTAQVAADEGAVFEAVTLPADAEIDASGELAWDVPEDADGWFEVLVHVTDTEGEVAVHRHHLLADTSPPTLTDEPIDIELLDASTVRLTAPAGVDQVGPVQYQWQRDGQLISTWQDGPELVDAGVSPDTAHEYAVRVRDASPTVQTSEWSEPIELHTPARTPGLVDLTQVKAHTAVIAGLEARDNPAATLYALQDLESGRFLSAEDRLEETPVWRTADAWSQRQITGLEPSKSYRFAASARNQEALATDPGPARTVQTFGSEQPLELLSVEASGTGRIITLTFDRPASLALKDLTLLNSQDEPVDPAHLELRHAPGDVVAELAIDQALSTGSYTLVVSGQGVQDLYGNSLDGNADGEPGGDYVEAVTIQAVEAEVQARHIFYHNSAFDTDSNDDAIAPDKQALLPGETATFDNYTSYVRGINGIIVDIADPADGAALSLDDFIFRVGNTDDVEAWEPGPDPIEFNVRASEGLDDADRIELIWEDDAVAQQWLQVVVMATDVTGLEADDVFYFGNAIGSTGHDPDSAAVGSQDRIDVRDNPHSFLNPADIANPYDMNRDARVGAEDRLIVRDHPTSFLSALRLISVPQLTTESAPELAALLVSPQTTEPADDDAHLTTTATAPASGPAAEPAPAARSHALFAASYDRLYRSSPHAWPGHDEDDDADDPRHAWWQQYLNDDADDTSAAPVLQIV